MLNHLFQIGVLLIFSTLLTSLAKNRLPRFFLAFSLCIFIGLELFSLYMSGTFIDYRFYAHFNINTLQYGYKQYLSQIIILIFIIASTTFLLFKYSAKITISKKTVYLSLLAAVFIMCMGNSIFGSIYKITKTVISPQDLNFKQALNQLEIPAETYIMPHNVEATKGKNIVIIIMESAEKNFMGSEFNNLMPELTALSKEMTFFGDMRMTGGGSWTSGALYSYLTGVPAFFSDSANSNLQRVSSSKITGLATVLEKAGYTTTFILGLPEFAGIDSLLKTYGIKILSEKNIHPKPPVTAMGMADYDTFAAAKREILKMKSPFAMGIVTVDSHHPAGVYDKRMKGKIPDRDSNLQFMISALDYHIGDFVNFLKDQGLYDSTAIYIFPDHLLMNSSDNTKKLLNKNPRKLMLLTNSAASSFSKKTNETIYQIDLPRLILDGAGVNSNALFLSDFLDSTATEEFIEQNKHNFVLLNNAALIRGTASTSTAFTIKRQDEKMFLATAVTTLPLKATPEYGYIVNIGYYGSVKEIRRGSHADYIQYSSSVPSFYVYLEKDNLKVKAGAEIISAQSNGLEQLINVSTEAFRDFNKKSKLYSKRLRKEELIAQVSAEVQIQSSGYVSSEPSIVRFNNNSESLPRGLSIITSQNGSYNIDSFDTYLAEKESRKFVSALAKSINQMNMVAVVASDDAARSLTQDIRKKIYDLGLKELARIQFRNAYVGYFHHGNIVEKVSRTDIIESLPAGSRFNNKITAQKNSLASDRTKFIAQAGGEIEGYRYTNSMEALDNSYLNGFRLFELDIIETADKKFVAAHDWESWAKATKYKGNLPPSRETFKKQNLHNKFTPLDIDDINKWFAAHPDATLVTDKVNDPQRFAVKFIDKNRLMMKLFTLDAVSKGLSSSIRTVLLSGFLLRKLGSSPLYELKKLGVKYLAVSRRMVVNNKEFFRKLKEAGIRVYVFHINDDGLDENYVFHNEFFLVYGMYADNWNFDNF